MRAGASIACGVAIAAAAYFALRGPAGVPPAPAAAPVPAVPAAPALAVVNIPFEDARPLLAALPREVPAALKKTPAAELAAAWPSWVSRHDADIRARLARGDEDSIVNFWLYGTTFTSLPRATARDIARIGNRDAAEDLLLGRLDHLIDGIASPGANERLRFARQVIERKGIDPATPEGKNRARLYLVEARARMVSDNARYRRGALASTGHEGFSTLYRDRGLSSDTSISADFAVDRAIDDATSRGKVTAGSIRRVALVGPGLDFTDKAEGHDFYPQQTIQPFALFDSLVRRGLAKGDDLRIITLDLSPRVNQHLEHAVQRARGGAAYVLQLPLAEDGAALQWNPALVAYWRQFGSAIGEDVKAIAAPSGVADVRVRALSVRPAVVTAIEPRDLNIVVQRLEGPEAERFDLIVATNILVYYDRFEQSLALANIARMLRPGGLFLTNYAVAPAAPFDPAAFLTTTVYFDRQQNGDTLFWYRRR
jgi:SAM-dependent methyltransferase